MKTQKNMSNSIKNNIITGDILGKCIYSCNKRAKNCRDQAREYRRSHAYQYAATYTQEKERYYRLKDQLLSIVEPICIHKETFIGEFFEREEGFWYEANVINYYYVYKVGGYTFHSPIRSDQLENGALTEEAKKGLPVIEIPQLVTTGCSTDEIISMQFVYKVLSLIESGNFTYIPIISQEYISDIENEGNKTA